MNNNIENNIYTNEKKSLIRDLINSIKLKLEKEKLLVVDRFEGNLAICENRENKEMLNVEISKLPDGVKEGDVLRFKNNKYELDEVERSNIENRINDKVKNLFDD